MTLSPTGEAVSVVEGLEVVDVEVEDGERTPEKIRAASDCSMLKLPGSPVFFRADALTPVRVRLDEPLVRAGSSVMLKGLVDVSRPRRASGPAPCRHRSGARRRR